MYLEPYFVNVLCVIILYSLFVCFLLSVSFCPDLCQSVCHCFFNTLYFSECILIAHLKLFLFYKGDDDYRYPFFWGEWIGFSPRRVGERDNAWRGMLHSWLSSLMQLKLSSRKHVAHKRDVFMKTAHLKLRHTSWNLTQGGFIFCTCKARIDFNWIISSLWICPEPSPHDGKWMPP